jgi:hypothetical protein
MGIVSAGTMFVSYLIVVIGHSVQGTPNGYIEGVTDVSWSVWSPPGTTFVQGVSAILNIVSFQATVCSAHNPTANNV